MIRRIGCRAHDYGGHSINQLSKLIVADGFRTTHLALKKALTNVDHLDHWLRPEFAGLIQGVTSEEGLDIAVLGAYLNYAHPNDNVRKHNIHLLESHIRIAKAMGARLVGTETGSLDEAYKYHPDNHSDQGFNRFKEAIEKVMPLVHACDTLMAVEGVAHHIIHTPKRLLRLIQEVDDPRLKVIFDINNLLTKDNWQDQEAIIHEAFDLLDGHIIAVHVKDFVFVDGEKKIVPIGHGDLALDTLMARVIESQSQIDVIAEDVPRAYLKSAYTSLATYVASGSQMG